jgi:hypothetical protein
MAGPPLGLESSFLFLKKPMKYPSVTPALQSIVHEDQYIVFTCLLDRRHAHLSE